MNIDYTSKELEKISSNMVESSSTYKGKDSINRLGNSCPNDARMPRSNCVDDLDSRASSSGQMWVLSWSFFAPCMTVLEVDAVVTTSKCLIRDLSCENKR